MKSSTESGAPSGAEPDGPQAGPPPPAGVADRPRRLRDRLFEPVDIASIAVFRIFFGAILFWEVWRYFDHDWIRRYYIALDFHFKYYGFGWVEPWPGDWMYVHFVAVAVVALCVMTGFLYRVASVLLFLGFTYWFLLDQTRYLNHFYLTALLAFLLALTPAHRARSLDARLREGVRSETISAWYLWLLRFQVGIVYFYAGVAKLNGDWLRGEPIRAWLESRSDYPLVGPWLGQESAAWFFAYGGLLFDLLVVPFLLWRRTRIVAFAAAVAFHALNKVLFSIGIFPVLMLAATTVFFEPDWPRRVLLFFAPRESGGADEAAVARPRGPVRGLVVTFLAVYAGLQILVPLRHFLYPGSVHWTEEGHRFAWHMKLRQKRATAIFIVRDGASGRYWKIDPRDYLSAEQSQQVGRWPDMSLQFAHFLADEIREQLPEVQIRVECKASLNGRDEQVFIDPKVDLAGEKRSLAHADWIVPLERELPRR